MEIQVNTGDQNSQPIGQNEIGQPTQNLKKTRLTYLVVAASVLASFTILGLVGYYLLGKQFSQYKTDKGKDQANPTPATTRTDLASNGEITYTGKDISVDVRELSERKSADVLVQSGSYYGPPFDPNLYQLELEPSQHLFAKSDSVDLKKYLGKNIKVRYREVKGVVMGEQQLVVVDSVE